MKAPYQIIRRDARVTSMSKFMFYLVDTRRPDPCELDFHIVTSTRGNSPIAPEWLRQRQAELNTKAMLD